MDLGSRKRWVSHSHNTRLLRVFLKLEQKLNAYVDSLEVPDSRLSTYTHLRRVLNDTGGESKSNRKPVVECLGISPARSNWHLLYNGTGCIMWSGLFYISCISSSAVRWRTSKGPRQQRAFTMSSNMCQRSCRIKLDDQVPGLACATVSPKMKE